MSLAVRSTLEVLEHQLEPYLHGSLNNTSKDSLVRIQTTPLHNMLSEQTLGLVDYHVHHAPNANTDFIDGKVKVQKNKHYPGFRAKLIKLTLLAIKRTRYTWQQRKDFRTNKRSKIKFQEAKLKNSKVYTC